MTRQVNRIARAALVMASALFLADCSGAEGHSPRPGAVGEAIGSTDATTQGEALITTGHCTSGDTRRCKFHLPAHNGVHPCVLGFQACEDTVWGECVEGEASPGEASDADAGSPHNGG